MNPENGLIDIAQDELERRVADVEAEEQSARQRLLPRIVCYAKLLARKMPSTFPPMATLFEYRVRRGLFSEKEILRHLMCEGPTLFQAIPWWYAVEHRDGFKGRIYTLEPGLYIDPTGDLYICSVHGVICEHDLPGRDFDASLSWTKVRPDDLSLDRLRRAEARLGSACVEAGVQT